MNRILIVEDDKAILTLLQMLIQLECRVDSIGVDTTLEAYRALNEGFFNYILVDFILEEENTSDFLYYLKTLVPKPKVVLISAVSKINEIADQHQVDYYLAKPFDVDKLLELLKPVC